MTNVENRHNKINFSYFHFFLLSLKQLRFSFFFFDVVQRSINNTQINNFSSAQFFSFTEACCIFNAQKTLKQILEHFVTYVFYLLFIMLIWKGSHSYQNARFLWHKKVTKINHLKTSSVFNLTFNLHIYSHLPSLMLQRRVQEKFQGIKRTSSMRGSTVQQWTETWTSIQAWGNGKKEKLIRKAIRG